MNYSIALYPRCRSGERVLKRKKTKKFQHVSYTRPVCMSSFSFKRVSYSFYNFFFSRAHISSTLSTSAEWELPGADKSPVICQTSPACPVLLFSCILLSVIESEKLSIWIQSRNCEKHSMAAFFSFFFFWITLALAPHTLGPDVRDNVTVKLQRKMVAGVKTNLQLGFSDVFYFVGCLTVEVNCCILVAMSVLRVCVCVCVLWFRRPWTAADDVRSLVATAGWHQRSCTGLQQKQLTLVEADWGL